MLTISQYAALAADINANAGEFGALPHTSDGAFVIAAAYNLAAAPEFVVWRTRVLLEEITQNGFAWTEVDNLTVGKARIWDWMFNNPDRSVNPSKNNVRAGIAECWSGTANRLAVQAVVLGHCKRNASRVEKLYATGPGTTASPAKLGFEGLLDYDNVKQAMGW